MNLGFIFYTFLFIIFLENNAHAWKARDSMASEPFHIFYVVS